MRKLLSILTHIWRFIINPASFPSNIQMRNGFWVVLLLVATEIASRDWEQTSLTVVPRGADTGSTVDYSNGASLKAGTLLIDHPGVITLLFADQHGRAPLFTLLMLAAICIIIIVIAPKLSRQQVFRKDISRAIRWIGGLITLDAFLFILYPRGHINRLILTVTHGQYEWARRGASAMWLAEAYLGLMIFVAAGLYQKSMAMQKERDLTI
jgi:hypothetical protein